MELNEKDFDGITIYRDPEIEDNGETYYLFYRNDTEYAWSSENTIKTIGMDGIFKSLYTKRSYSRDDSIWPLESLEILTLEELHLQLL